MNERIRAIRRLLDLTQKEFAEKIGMKQNTIALIETGKRNTSNQTILSICREFSVNEEWLRYGKGEMFRADASNELEALAKKYDLTLIEYLIIEKWLKFPLSKRKNILSFVQNFIKEIQSATDDVDDFDTELSAEEEYEKSLGFARNTKSPALNTIDGKRESS